MSDRDRSKKTTEGAREAPSASPQQKKAERPPRRLAATDRLRRNPERQER